MMTNPPLAVAKALQRNQRDVPNASELIHQLVFTRSRQVLEPYLEALRVQRWKDHRSSQHNRIKRSLHLLNVYPDIVTTLA